MRGRLFSGCTNVLILFFLVWSDDTMHNSSCYLLAAYRVPCILLSSTLPWVRIGTIIPTLRKRKLRLREIRQGLQRHTVSEWLSEG